VGTGRSVAELGVGMALLDFPPYAGRIRPTAATEALFAQVDELRAQKRQHAWLSPEWLRLGAAICTLTEAIRKIETEGRR